MIRQPLLSTQPAILHCGSETEEIGAVACHRAFDSLPSSYNVANMAACCTGQHTKWDWEEQGTAGILCNFIDIGLLQSIDVYEYGPHKDAIVAGGWGIKFNDKVIPFQGNMGSGSDSGIPFITMGIGSAVDNIQQETGCINRGPTNPFPVKLVKHILRIDGAYCDKDWCPWSDTCVKSSLGMQNYCSTMDGQGHPRLHTDINCYAWCNNVDLQGECGTASFLFCQKYPNHPACYCQNYQASEAFKKVEKIFEATPGCADDPDCAVMPPATCWAYPCTNSGTEHDPDRALLTTSQWKDKDNECKNMKVNICTMMINIIKAGGKVIVSNDDFEQVCGEQKPPSPPTPSPSPPPPPPPPTPSPPTPPPPTPSPPPTPTPPSPPTPTPAPSSSVPWIPIGPAHSPTTPSSTSYIPLIVVGSLLAGFCTLLSSQPFKKK